MQTRYVNFGTSADDQKIKAINRLSQTPGLLTARDGLFQAVAPDRLVIAPHGVLMENGTIVEETEQVEFQVPNSFTPQDYTVVYRHEDEAIVGGVPAELTLETGLSQTIENGIPLGWVRYPGGSVPLDPAHLFPAPSVKEPPYEVAGELDDIAAGSGVYDVPHEALEIVVPSAPPYTVSVGTSFPSYRLPVGDQRVVCRSIDDSQDLVRVDSGTPGTLEYRLDSSRVVSFSPLDATKLVSFFDMTYGSATSMTGTTGGVADSLVTLPLNQTAPLRVVRVRFVAVNAGYTVELLDAWDRDGQPITTVSANTETGAEDGSVSTLTVRLLDGVTHGVGNVTVRVRETVPAGAEGLWLGIEGSSVDVPFA